MQTFDDIARQDYRYSLKERSYRRCCERRIAMKENRHRSLFYSCHPFIGPFSRKSFLYVCLGLKIEIAAKYVHS